MKSFIYNLLFCTLFLSCDKEGKLGNAQPYDEDVVHDIDGNVYHTVKIGSQIWMVENLKTTHYNDGTAIPNVTDGSGWQSLSTPAFCWYNNDITNKSPYGALYNWHAVNTDKLCPSGWHVPTDAEWNTLAGYLTNKFYSAPELEATGNAWPNSVANNKTGFTAYPGGYRGAWSQGNQVHEGGGFGLMGNYGEWWTSTQTGQYIFTVWYRSIRSTDISLSRLYKTDSPNSVGKSAGLSVRCIKNEN